MTKHLCGFLLLSVFSSCNLLAESTSNALDEKVNNGTNVGDLGNDVKDVGGDVDISKNTSVDVGPCIDGTECDSGICEAGICAEAACSDDVQNGDETDLDCGGSCTPCLTGMVCSENADCDAGACTNKICKPVSCVDELKNGNETDFDCGGDCSPCTSGFDCAANSDCDSANCIDTVCKASVCGDNIVNGMEECDEGAVDSPICNSDCTNVRCGDGITNMAASEACDDGNIITETCTYGEKACSVCANDCTIQAGTTHFCGDGNVENNEVCDDAINDGSPGSCLADCSAAVVCGDGMVMGTEGCDDGNTITEACVYGAMSCIVCDATCLSVAGATSYCGDGATDIGNNEQCDDGNLIEADMCNNACQLSSRLVFTTSQTTEGNFGGLAGGDAYCQSLADAAGLNGTYMAWISDSTGSPATRFTQSAIPYKLIDGTLIANDWADLIDGSLANPINLTELGGTPPDGTLGICNDSRTVWTNTKIDGTVSSQTTHCENWTGVGSSKWGRWHQTGSWTDWCSGGTCSWFSNLYCFEQ